MEDQDRRVVEAMAVYGGGFVKALSYAFLEADPDNFKKLRGAFPAEWKEYEKRARKEAPPQP